MGQSASSDEILYIAKNLKWGDFKEFNYTQNQIENFLNDQNCIENKKFYEHFKALELIAKKQNYSSSKPLFYLKKFYSTKKVEKEKKLVPFYKQNLDDLYKEANKILNLPTTYKSDLPNELLYDETIKKPNTYSLAKSINELQPNERLEIEDCYKDFSVYSFEKKDFVDATEENIKEFSSNLLKRKNFFKILDSLPFSTAYSGGVQTFTELNNYLTFFVNRIVSTKDALKFKYNRVFFYSNTNNLQDIVLYRCNKNMKKEIEKCKDVYIIDLRLKKQNQGGHANSLLIDKKFETIVLFEPNGVEILPIKILKQFISNLGLDHLNTYKFENATTCLIKPRIQGLQKLTYKTNEEDQYCITYSYYFILMKLLNRNLSYDELIELMKKNRNTFQDIVTFQYFLEFSFRNYKHKNLVIDGKFCWIKEKSILEFIRILEDMIISGHYEDQESEIRSLKNKLIDQMNAIADENFEKFGIRQFF